MHDPNQLIAPEAFAELFVEADGGRPSASREHIFERYEFCEDLANLLTEQAGRLRQELGMSPSEVLRKCYLGLLPDDSGVTRSEAPWVIGRLAELLEWRFNIDDLPTA